jgi:hypothetical protein
MKEPEHPMCNTMYSIFQNIRVIVLKDKYRLQFSFKEKGNTEKKKNQNILETCYKLFNAI